MSWVIVQCLVSFLMRIIPCRKYRRFENEDVEEEEGKTFQNYLDLPPELRMMIIDEMGIKDRCRFRRCSKLCNKEAKSSKNYYLSIYFLAHNENGISIGIKYIKNQRNFNIENGYSLRIYFKKEEKKLFDIWPITQKFVVYRYFLRRNELWRKKLSKSTDLVEYGAKYFKKILIENQKYINHLCICGDLFKSKLKDYDFGIERLDRLEVLSIRGTMNVPLYLSKLRRPLRKIWVTGQENSNYLTEFEQIYQVRDHVDMPKTKFTKEQLLRMSATVVKTAIGDLTEQDIFDIIQTWQNGTIGTERRVYEWINLRGSNFNILQLFRLLGKEVYYTVGRGSIEIQHTEEAGRTARLSYSVGYNIEFEVNRRN